MDIPPRTYKRPIPLLPPTTSYSEFYNCALLPSQPVLFSGIADSWPAYERWTLITSAENKYGQTRTPNLHKLALDFQGIPADVVIMQNNEPISEQMKFDEFCKLIGNNKRGLFAPNPDGPAYLKDFHFVQHLPKSENMYNVPHVFADDWFNTAAIWSDLDDYRFLYFGSHESFYTVAFRRGRESKLVRQSYW